MRAATIAPRSNTSASSVRLDDITAADHDRAPASPLMPAPTRKSGARVFVIAARSGSRSSAWSIWRESENGTRISPASARKRTCGVHDPATAVARSGPIRRPPSTGVKYVPSPSADTASSTPRRRKTRPPTSSPTRTRRSRSVAPSGGLAGPAGADAIVASPCASSTRGPVSPGPRSSVAAVPTVHQQTSAASAETAAALRIQDAGADDRVFCSSRSTTFTSYASL